jgi:hypothetical protein
MINNILLLLFVLPFQKTFAGLKVGMLCAGILMVVFLEIFLPFSALFSDETPNLLNVTLQSLMNFYFIHKVSTVSEHHLFQDLIFLKFSL